MKRAAIQQRLRGLALAGLAMAALASAAQATVVTSFLGGGPRQGNMSFTGSTDGNTFEFSQFNGPTALAFDSAGTLYIADRNNGKVRKVTFPGDEAASVTSTLISGLNQPIGIVADPGDFLYVLTTGDGLLRKYNRYGQLTQTITNGLAGASALTMDGSTNFYVTIPGAGTNGGLVKRITRTNTVIIATGFNQPQGLVMLASGLLAVSDTGNHAIQLVNPANGVKTLLSGSNGAGPADGPKEFAQFNRPQGIAKSPSGNLVVADRYNHKVRMVETNGTVTTLFGVDTNQWIPTYPALGLYEGWVEGDDTIAAAREPIGVLVNPVGRVYFVDAFYHLLRAASGAPLAAGGGSGGTNTSTNVVIIPSPAFSPISGYYPMGQTINVSSEFPVYYTTDGSEPTTNSRQVSLSANVGTINWNEPLRDLTSLRLRAIQGTNSSAVVGGVAVSANELGVSRDVSAGVGSTVLIPLVMNLRSNDTARSLQFRVEVVPLNGAPAVLPQFRAISIGTNDFVSVVGASVPGTVGLSSYAPYSIGDIRGLMITAIGTNANFLVQRFGTVAMLVVPLDPNTTEGQSYRVDILYPSATSDGAQSSIPMAPMTSRQINVTNLSYIVGDSSPGVWYHAGEFGDGNLSNNDVNNAIYASVGIRTPHAFSDAFDAMDAFPPDEPGMIGGDGEIRYLDWQLILERSLRLDPNNYRRFWTTGGYRSSDVTALPAKTLRSKSGAVPGPGCVWVREAIIGAQSVVNLSPGSACSMPVYVKVAAGSSLGGLSFRAVLTPGPGALPVSGLTFSAASGKPSPSVQFAGATPGELICAWPLVPSPAFVPALQGSNLIGSLNFNIPPGAAYGQHYTLRFSVVDGAPNRTNQYNLESIPAYAWVGAAQRPTPILSEQWQTNFFHSTTNLLADPFADADGDGIPNWKEFLAGTNPTNRLSRLQMLDTTWVNSPVPGARLSWLSAPGRLYTIERCDRLGGTNWVLVASGLVGDGNVKTFIDGTASHVIPQFYRLRLQP